MKECWFWFLHEWGKWGAPGEFGYDMYQCRTCAKCGYTQQRRIGWWLSD